MWWSVQPNGAPLSFSEADKAMVPAAWTLPATPNGLRLERARKMSRGATAETAGAEVRRLGLGGTEAFCRSKKDATPLHFTYRPQRHAKSAWQEAQVVSHFSGRDCLSAAPSQAAGGGTCRQNHALSGQE